MAMGMTWREVKGKKVICKDGVYFALSGDQEITELRRLLDDMQSEEPRRYLEDSRRTGQ